MPKLITLELNGDFDQGFKVRFSMAPEGCPNETEIDGKLPENTQILQDYQKWIDSYSSLGRIWRKSYKNHKSRRIVFRRAINVKAIGINSTHKQCEDLAKKLCDNLNDWLTSPHFIDIRDEWLKSTNNDDEIRVLIRTKNKELWKLPWHKLKFLQGHSNIEIALAPQSFLPHIASTLAPYKRKPEVRILAILGDSTNIDVEKDRQELEKLTQSSQAEITFLVEPKIDELGEQLWHQPWDILFFSGHSNTEENLGKIYINEEESLDINYLRESLKTAVRNGLKIAIFNSCEGLGLAQLHNLLIPQLLVMREPIPDPVAQAFLKHFLNSFSQETSSFYSAVGESRRKLQIEEQKFPCATWLPIICQHPAIIPPTWKDLKSQGVIANSLLNDRFELIKSLNPLSEGAFGTIYLAKDILDTSNHTCVVKKLKQDWADLETAKRLFTNEAKILEKLATIPNLPKFIAYFQQNNDYYLVQEYLEGEPLSDFLCHNKFDEAEALRFLRLLLNTLKAVHKLNLIHRDIKPSNIIKHEKNYYLIDFGAAKLDYVELQNNSTISIGTPHYAAPEQLIGKPCFASDIYALGITIIQALTGLRPSEFTRDNEGNITQLKSLKIDKYFADCLNKMVAEKSLDRYQNIQDVINEISGFPTQTNPESYPIKKNKVFRNPKIVFLLLIILLGGGITTGIIFNPKKEPANNPRVPHTIYTAYQEYVHDEYGFKIQYPDNWERIDINNPITNEVVIFKPKSSWEKPSLENPQIIIEVEDLKSPESLEDSSKLAQDVIKKNSKHKILVDNFNQTLANSPAYQLIYTIGEGDKITKKKMEIGMIRGDRRYIITYEASEQEYDKNQPIAKKIIESFQLLNQN